MVRSRVATRSTATPSVKVGKCKRLLPFKACPQAVAGVYDRAILAAVPATAVSAAGRRVSGCDGTVGCNPLAQRDTLARRHAQKVRGTPNDVVGEFVRGPVNEDDLPHHPDDPAAALIVETITELTGEMVEIDRAPLGCDSGVDQPGGGDVVESEAGFQDRVKLCEPGVRHFAVDGRDTDKQRRCREPAFVGLELIRPPRTFGEAGDQGLERCKHGWQAT